MLRLNALKNRGFTLLETLIIVLILGIGLAIATPSFLSLIEKLRLEQAVVEVRSTFREAQRQAIREGESCLVVLDLTNSKLTAPCININQRSLPEQVKIATNITLIPEEALGANQEKSTEDFYARDIGSQLVASTDLTNLGLQISSGSKWHNTELRIGSCYVKVSPEKTYLTCSKDSNSQTKPKLVPVSFGILGTAEFSIAKPKLSGITPLDPSAKIIFYTSESSNSIKKCIAVSNTLGLTRAGIYTGSTEPQSITSSGNCKATE
jgi:prepilin-type N-terminal cleavage/methylation domain-containing protein